MKTELNDCLDESDGSQPKYRVDSVAQKIRKESTDSILDGMSLIESKVYSHMVCLPVIERTKRKWTRWNILRKFAGVPFAMLYGIFLYALLRFVFSPTPFQNDKTLNVTTLDNGTKLDTLKKSEDTTYFGSKHQPNHLYISGVFTVTLGVSSVLSKGTRCTLLLILPSVITGRSRAFLSTFIMSLLVDGPIHNLGHNYNEISRKSSCTYEAFVNLTRNCIDRLNAAFRGIDGRSPGDGDLDFNLTFPQVEKLKGELSTFQEGINGVLTYASILRKILTAISLLLLLIDAVQYLKRYYSDSSFDNKYISRSIRRYWTKKNHDDVIPLRNWELNEGYRINSSAKFTKREFTKITRKMLPTIIFGLFVALVMVLDYLVAKVLISSADEDTVKLMVDGFAPFFKRIVLKIIGQFEKASKDCTARPFVTSSKSYTVISILMAVASLSCIFEVYMSRVRSKLCNIFYTKRAQERADYLRYRVVNGRINRRVQLKLTIQRSLERHRRVIQFYPCTMIAYLCRRFFKSKFCVFCPGCEWTVNVDETVKSSFTMDEAELECRLCDDCNKEL